MPKLQSTLLATLILLGSVLSAHAATDWKTQPAPFAKELAEHLVSSQTGLIDVIFHVTPPGSSENYAVAAHTNTEQGSKSGDDDMSVITTGKPLVEVQKDGIRIGVVLPLHDQKDRTIGALGLMYTYHSGEDQQDFLTRSKLIRDTIAKKISSRDALFEAQHEPR